jgi:drug/metabolite transporter (DMT)-like permease
MTGLRSKSAVIGAFALIYLLWGSTYLAVALAVSALPPFLLMGTRSIAGGLVLFAGARIAGHPATSVRIWARAAVCGLLLFVACHGTLAYVQQRVPSGIAAVLLATIPFWMAFLNAVLAGGDRPTARQLLLLVPGFAGVALIVLRHAETGTRAYDASDLLLAVGGACAWALGSILSKRWSPPESTVAFCGMALITGGVALMAISAVLGEPASFDIGAVPATAIGGWFYLTIAGTIVAFAAYVWLLKRVSPTLVATYTFVNPIIAVALGWAVLGERLNGTMALGALLVIGSVIGLLASPVRSRSGCGAQSFPTKPKASATNSGRPVPPTAH